MQISFPGLFYCMNVYNDTSLEDKCQSGNLYENKCPQEKNIGYFAVYFSLDKVPKKSQRQGNAIHLGVGNAVLGVPCNVLP